jgi:ectoine hydroxylase-related dioxygenase (phytanoyl-CoA dioxygenase family)
MNSFSKNGFSIIDVFSTEEHRIISDTIKKSINDRLNDLTGDEFTLSDLKDYHNLSLADNVHKQVVDAPNRCIDITNFSTRIKKNKFIKKIMDESWGHHEYRLIFIGNLKNFDKKENCCSYRISRPNLSQDVGGIHLDKHVGGIKNLGDKNLLTLWIPIEGFNEKYTLNFAPGSHQFNHPDNCINDDSNYISMTYNNTYTNKFKYYRPQLNLGQGVIFDPNLLHGASYNLGEDTRVSIELRFFNAKTKYEFDR